MSAEPARWTETPTSTGQESPDVVHRPRREEGQLYNAIVQQSSDAIFAVGREACLSVWNDAAEQLYGRSRSEVIGESVAILECSGCEGFWLSVSAEMADIRQPMSREGCCRRPDGRERFVGFSVSPLFSPDGAFDGFSVICRDMTLQHVSHEALEHSLSEKDHLLKEVHHRVKNNLQVICSLLRLQASYLDDGYAKWMFRNSEERVKCMALVHERLYRSQHLSRVNFRGYLEELIADLVRNHASDASSVEIDLDLDDVELPIDRAVPCGLIVNELVTNALKHAFREGRAGRLHIGLERVDSSVRLCIADDGPGLAEGFVLEGAATLGLRVVHILSTQLGATVAFDRSAGTRFELTFECERKRGRS